MRCFILSIAVLLVTSPVFSQAKLVKNIKELNSANKMAQPGDIIVLQNGTWKDIEIKLTARGTKEKLITYKAEQAGKVIISGKSRLSIGGEYLSIDGLYFKDGYSGDRATIEFRNTKSQLANNCRVTNTTIENFSNPKRLDDNNWILFCGKNNRLDHSSFKDKNNLGVILAVDLEDPNSRENFHSIDHNYFGRRIPLASNGGEIIRVGVSQYCEFNSNTQITDNFFEHCDGETEIVSIKSGSNIVRGNLFKECQGGVVLRHGDNNIVENNIFWGNNKPGTGGVRIINKGQWVVNNFFYKSRGVDFRSPLSIMNGIPNSPANRYVQVTDAVIANNIFMECSAISFCEGSDAERTLPPANVLFLNNLFYNTRDSIIYYVFDDVSGIRFAGNEINKDSKLSGKGILDREFFKAIQKMEKLPDFELPITNVKGTVAVPDSINKISQNKLGHSLSTMPGFSPGTILKINELKLNKNTGSDWFAKGDLQQKEVTKEYNCATAGEIYKILDQKIPASIVLTGDKYVLDKPFIISREVKFTSRKMAFIKFITPPILSVFEIAGNGKLTLGKVVIDGGQIKAKHFISNDSSGSSSHFNLLVHDVMISRLDRANGCQDFFFVYKSSVADTIFITQAIFKDNKVNLLVMEAEKDDKGYYNAETIRIQRNLFKSNDGIVASIYRGGNDESTMGPNLDISENEFVNCNSSGKPLFSFTGVQVTSLINNEFKNCNLNGILVKYQDRVRARHRFQQNKLLNSGKLETNQFAIADLTNK